MKIDQFKDNFADNIYTKQKLAKYAWFGVGGNAEILYIPEKEKSLEKFLKAKPSDCKIFSSSFSITEASFSLSWSYPSA